LSGVRLAMPEAMKRRAAIVAASWEGTQMTKGTDEIQDGQPREDDEDIELIDDEDLESIGDLGNEQDDAESNDAPELDDSGAPTRRSWLFHRFAECFRALDNMRSGPAKPWPTKRISEAHWRDLGDRALGIKTDQPDSAAAFEQVIEEFRQELWVEEQLVQATPKEKRAAVRACFRNVALLSIFERGFERERERWEADYWDRAFAESRGKEPWTGPSGREGGLY
jgi:hypothetical protein